MLGTTEDKSELREKNLRARRWKDVGQIKNASLPALKQDLRFTLLHNTREYTPVRPFRAR
jgi:hypothetical protein